MSEVSLIFPHQLFLDNPCLQPGRAVVMVEHDLYFAQFKFHKHKLILHRASMMAYKARLEQKGYVVTYHSCQGKILNFTKVFEMLSAAGVTNLTCADPCDYLLERSINRLGKKYQVAIHYVPGPGFILSKKDHTGYYENRKHYFLNSFYIDQRKHYNILLSEGEPSGGKWTFDTENRKKLPAGIKIPVYPVIEKDAFVQEAEDYINHYYAENYGEAKNFNYPIDHERAAANLQVFLAQRFKNYGPYQDAIDDENSFLFHSVITPALNIGLLTPIQVIDSTLDYAQKHFIPLNSLEGFIRQVLGWREFIRILYEREGSRQRTTNHFNHTRPLPKQFWEGTTGIEPVDTTIKKLLKTGYSNHIERLMILGNFMLLCEIDPNDVYEWFMTLYIDAYDWVMVPNVYGMSQFADGGLMSTKPYISGSNYILKMSNYPKGEWCDIWDALYWCFIDKHRQEFLRNPRMSMMVRQLDKMDPKRFSALLDLRKTFLTSLEL
jgi:deoxyribodipyrimidine photolyase-related protein